LELDDLRQLSFETGPKAVDYVKAQAKSHSFTLALRDSSASDRIRMQCHRADHSKGINTTNTRYEVRAKVHKRDNSSYIRIKDGLVHDHGLLLPSPSPDSVTQAVTDLIAVGISNTQIVQFIEKQTGRLFSTADLAVLRERKTEEQFLCQKRPSSYLLSRIVPRMVA
jgi:hypothetical protein